MASNYDDIGKVADWVSTSAAAFGGKLATVDLASGRQRTYAEWHERVAKVAGMLRTKGIEKGDRVAVLAMNSTDVLDIIFACWRIGAIHLPLNFRLTADELTFIVGDAGPKIAILDDEFAETGNAVRESTEIGEWIGMDGLGGDTAFERAIANAEPVYAQVSQTLDDICCIMYSSGTTGLPKGVTLSHGNFFLRRGQRRAELPLFVRHGLADCDAAVSYRRALRLFDDHSLYGRDDDYSA